MGKFWYRAMQLCQCFSHLLAQLPMAGKGQKPALQMPVRLGFGRGRQQEQNIFWYQLAGGEENSLAIAVCGQRCGVVQRGRDEICRLSGRCQYRWAQGKYLVAAGVQQAGFFRQLVFCQPLYANRVSPARPARAVTCSQPHGYGRGRGEGQRHIACLFATLFSFHRPSLCRPSKKIKSSYPLPFRYGRVSGDRQAAQRLVRSHILRGIGRLILQRFSRVPGPAWII